MDFRRIIHYFNLASAILLTASIILWIPMMRPAMYLFFITYLVEIFSDQKWKSTVTDKRKFLVYSMFLLFFMAFIYMPFEDSTNYFFKVLERRLPLFGFALICLFGLNNLYKLSWFLNTFILTSVISVLYLFFIKVGIGEVIGGSNWIELFNNARIKWINTHMVFNFYLNISLIAVWFILKNRSHVMSSFLKSLYILSALIVFVALVISEGRTGIILLMLILAFLLFYEVWVRKKKLAIIVTIIIPFIIVGFVSHKDRFSVEKLKNDPRFCIWKSAAYVIKQQPVFGFGISDAQNQFSVARTKFMPVDYQEDIKNIALYHAHNQYLQIWMEFGLIGLILVFFLYFYPLKIIDSSKKLLLGLFTLMWSFESLFEIFITFSFSVYYFVILLMLFYMKDNVSKKLV